MNNKPIIIGVLALIVGFGLGYWSGSASAATTKTASSTSRGAYAGGFTRGGTGTQMGDLLSGTVASEDSGSITLNTRDGSSHIVLLTPDTTVQKSVAGSISDIAVGATVIVTGTTNSDGSVSAASIQIRPAGSFPGFATSTAGQ